ncbi:MAG: YdcF family protein [Bacteroidales bacterium]
MYKIAENLVMYFVLSKILRYVFSPVLWIAILIIVAFCTKDSRGKKRLLIISGILFLFFTNTFIADECMRLWEIPAVRQNELNAPYDVGILLTGMCTYDKTYDRVNFNRSSDRLLQTIDLYQKGIIKHIFIAGGSGELRQPDFQEARILYDFLVQSGIPAADVAYEINSRNTAENAIESALVLKPQYSDSTYLLITSGYHLRRAAACFRKQGFDVDLYSTDRFTGKRKFHVEYLLLPRNEALNRWEVLLRETNGMVVYKLKGYV